MKRTLGPVRYECHLSGMYRLGQLFLHIPHLSYSYVVQPAYLYRQCPTKDPFDKQKTDAYTTCCCALNVQYNQGEDEL